MMHFVLALVPTCCKKWLCIYFPVPGAVLSSDLVSVCAISLAVMLVEESVASTFSICHAASIVLSINVVI